MEDASRDINQTDGNEVEEAVKADTNFKNVPKLEKHDLATVQEGESHLPFSTKLDSAIDFIDEALAENIA